MPPPGLLLVALTVSAAVAFACCAPPRGAAPPEGAAPGGSAVPTDGAAPAAAGTLRVLVLTGGGFHDFPGNVGILLAGLQSAVSPSAAAPGGSPPTGARWQFTTLALGPGDASSAADRRRLEADDVLSRCDVVLAYTQGDVGLSDAARERLLAFVRGGGGFVGLHCALDSHPGWTDYARMLGGRFERHPPFGPVAVRVDDVSHPVTAGLPAAWSLADEFYHLTDWIPDGAHVLMTGVSPEGGERRPVTWTRQWGEGRVVGTILGHGPETHADGRFQALVAQALRWAAPRAGERAPP